MSTISSSSSLSSPERCSLLDQLARITSDADTHADPARYFLPLPSHGAALSDQYTIIRGERGAGKTALFRFVAWLQKEGGTKALRAMFPQADLAESAQWIDGFSEFGPYHPSTITLDAFGQTANIEALRIFWSAHLASCLAEFVPALPLTGIEELRNLKTEHRHEPGKLVAWAKPRTASLLRWLDAAEQFLAATGETIYFAYDHLDRIGLSEPAIRNKYAGALLNLWMSLADRYRRLRAKVYIREDLFAAAKGTFTDANKLDYRSTQLIWNEESLYRVLIRHMAAQGQDLRDWLTKPVNSLQDKDALLWQHQLPLHDPPPILSESIRAKLGYLPPYPLLPGHQKQLIDRLAGPTIGRGATAGPTWRWIPSRIQDARGAKAPRPLLNLIRYAALHARERMDAPGDQLLTEVDLVAALKPTSSNRIDELVQEYKFVRRLEHFRGAVMRLPREEFQKRLAEPWPGEADGMGNQGEKVYEELVRLGVLQLFMDGTVDIPDIYRYAFDIKRQGRPKVPR